MTDHGGMTLGRAADEAVTAVRHTKQEQLDKGSQVMPTSLLAYRGRDLIAMVWPDEGGGRPMLAALRVMAIGFCADIVAAAFETYHSDLPANPVTGKPWASGDLHDLATHHQGRRRGWISDAILVMAANRAEDANQRVLPYRQTGRRVKWLPEPEATNFGGPILDGIKRLMTYQSVGQTTGRDALETDLDFETRLAMQDCATISILTHHHPAAPADVPSCLVALSAEPGSERAKLILAQTPDSYYEGPTA